MIFNPPLGIKRKSTERNSNGFFISELEKSDSDMSVHYNEARQRDIDNKLNTVFGKSQEEVTTEELSQFV